MSVGVIIYRNQLIYSGIRSPESYVVKISVSLFRRQKDFFSIMIKIKNLELVCPTEAIRTHIVPPAQNSINCFPGSIIGLLCFNPCFVSVDHQIGCIHILWHILPPLNLFTISILRYFTEHLSIVFSPFGNKPRRGILIYMIFLFFKTIICIISGV